MGETPNTPFRWSFFVCLEGFYRIIQKERELMIGPQLLKYLVIIVCLDFYRSFCVSGLPDTSVLQHLFFPQTSPLGCKSLQRRHKKLNLGL